MLPESLMNLALCAPDPPVLAELRPRDRGGRLARPGRVVAALVLAISLFAASPARASDVTCDTGGDQAGWSIAAGRDFDGDGVLDIAMGAPCARVNGESNVGRVFVHSGASGRRIMTLSGTTMGQKFGGAIDFVDDISGDGHADLVVGSLSWNIDEVGDMKLDAGKVDVYDRERNLLLSIEGAYGSGNFGEAVAGLGDIDGDTVPDLLVGAGGDRAFGGGDRLGAAYVLSGDDGSLIDMSLGDLKFDRWGAVVSSIADIDGDDIEDLLISSNSADLFIEEGVVEDNNGLVRVLSGADLSTVLFTMHGSFEDKLGRASTATGDLDGDDREDIAVGAPGVTVGSAGNGGNVRLYSTNDNSLLRTLTEPQPQVGAKFGSSLAAVASVNGDAIPDIVAGAPFAEVNGIAGTGRVHMFSASNGNDLWTVSGSLPGARIGHCAVAVGDWNGDSTEDVAVSGPGDAFRARRGSGTVRVLSGSDGAELARFGGRLGAETRMLVLGRNLAGNADLRNVKSFGRTSKLRQSLLRGERAGALSIAVLDDDVNAAPTDLKIAVASGPGSSSQRVQVIRGGRRRGTVSDFSAEFSGDYDGGVNVAAGDLTLDDGFELAIAQADTGAATVEVSVYRRIDTSPFGLITWIQAANFPVFAPADEIDGFVVDADGATVAIGRVSLLGERIVVGPERGTPVVRVMDEVGTVEAEWLAFPPTQGNSGTSVAVGNLDGTGLAEIVTVPRTGQLRVRAFSGDGTAFVSPDSGSVVDFVIPPTATNFATDFRVAIADIDLDGKGEILVLANSDAPTEILAFEMDGSTPEGWPDRLRPFGPISAGTAALATTDRFVRHR